MEDILLFGMGGHAKSVIDSIEGIGKYRIFGILDKKENIGLKYRQYEVIGEDIDALKYYEKGIKKAFISIGYMGKGKKISLRKDLYEKLKYIGYIFPTIIDPTAILSKDIKLGEGNYVGKRCIINSNTILGKMCIVNTGVIIEHDCMIEDYTHIAAGGIICGNVYLEKYCFIGANTTIIQGKKIGENTIIGAGTIITKDIENDCIVYNKIKKEIIKME